MGGVKSVKSKVRSAKRGPRVSVPRAVATGLSARRRAKTHSPLRDPVWAVITDTQTITGFRHRKALQVAKEIRGTVTTNAAANRIVGGPSPVVSGQ